MATVTTRSWKNKGGIVEGYIADYRDADGRRIKKRFRLRKEAEAYLVDQLKEVQDIKDGKAVAPKGAGTLAQAGVKWLKNCENGSHKHEALEASTVREYRRHLNTYICHPEIGIGHRKLGGLAYPDVTEFEARLFEIGKSRALITKVRASLSSLLSDAVEHKLTDRNVLSDAPRSRRKQKTRNSKKVVAPSKSELGSLIENASPKFRPLLVTLIFTGMRISEARGLHWRSVDFDNGVIEVCERADRFHQMGPPKSKAGERKIPMAPMVRTVLLEWKVATCFSAEDDLVFPTEKGTVQSLSNLGRRHFHPLQIERGIIDKNGKPKYGFHALRHAAASLFIESGMNAKEIQNYLGHASIQMTFDRYGHLFRDPVSEQAAFERVEARLFG